jgi:dipeptidyl aminopeptidase/acylaminoacyl peptidase
MDFSQVSLDRIKHGWVYRFTENGVSLHDYHKTVEKIQDWSEWCGAWSRTAAGHVADAERAEARGQILTAAELRLLAASEYHFSKYLFVHDMGQLKEAHQQAVVSYRAAVAHLPWPAEPVSIPFADQTLPGFLRLPTGASSEPVPVVIVIPGLDAAKEEMHRFEDVFLARGMATLTYDGPGQGETEYSLPIRPDYEIVLTAAVDYLCTRPEVDANQIGVFGVSLGGYYAARGAAVEGRIRAAVSVGGCYSFGEAWPDLAFLTRQAFQVRSFLTDMQAAEEYANQVTLETSPGRISIPFLVVHGLRDTLFTAEQAQKIARFAGAKGVLWMEPEGNHVCHNLARSLRPAVADWMWSQIKGAEA